MELSILLICIFLYCESIQLWQSCIREKHRVTRILWYYRNISFKECPACVKISYGFQNMLLSFITRHLPRPLMKLMTLALLQHTAVPSIVGKEDIVSRVVLN